MELESLYISFPRWSLVGTATYIQNPEHVVSPGVLVSPEMQNGILKKTSQALRRGLLLLQSSHRGCLRCAWQFNSEARNHLGVSARGFEVGQTIVTTIDGSDIWRSAS